MWGKKSQKKNDVSLHDDQTSGDDVNTSAFSVHTMQDDVNGQQATQPVASSQQPEQPQASAPSPFATQDTDTTAPVAPSPFADTTATPSDTTASSNGVTQEAPPTIDATESAERNAASQQPFASFGQEQTTTDAHQYGDNATTSVTDAYSDNAKGAKAHSLLTMVMILIGILLVFGIIFGVYWFNKQVTVDEVTLDDATVDTAIDLQDDTSLQDTTMPDENPTEEFGMPTLSYDLPNSVVISDQETAIAQWKDFMTTTDATMRQEHITGPITFLIKDAQQNPISFRAFANMVHMDLPEEALAALGDTFDVYAYHDNDTTYFGFAVDTRDPAQAQTALLAAEWHLPEILAPLFLGEVPRAENPVFAESVYDGHKIRYMNFTPGPRSIDYSFTQGRFLVATTKDMMRRMLDRLFPGEGTSAPAASVEMTGGTDTTHTTGMMDPGV